MIKSQKELLRKENISQRNKIYQLSIYQLQILNQNLTGKFCLVAKSKKSEKNWETPIFESRLHEPWVIQADCPILYIDLLLKTNQGFEVIGRSILQQGRDMIFLTEISKKSNKICSIRYLLQRKYQTHNVLQGKNHHSGNSNIFESFLNSDEISTIKPYKNKSIDNDMSSERVGYGGEVDDSGQMNFQQSRIQETKQYNKPRLQILPEDKQEQSVQNQKSYDDERHRFTRYLDDSTSFIEDLIKNIPQKNNENATSPIKVCNVKAEPKAAAQQLSQICEESNQDQQQHFTTSEKWYCKKFNKKSLKLKLKRKQTMKDDIDIPNTGKQIKAILHETIFMEKDEIIRQICDITTDVPTKVKSIDFSLLQSEDEKIKICSLIRNDSSSSNQWKTSVSLPQNGTILIQCETKAGGLNGCMGLQEIKRGQCDLFDKQGNENGNIYFKCKLISNFVIQTQEIINRGEQTFEEGKQPLKKAEKLKNAMQIQNIQKVLSQQQRLKVQRGQDPVQVIKNEENLDQSDASGINQFLHCYNKESQMHKNNNETDENKEGQYVEQQLKYHIKQINNLIQNLHSGRKYTENNDHRQQVEAITQNKEEANKINTNQANKVVANQLSPRKTEEQPKENNQKVVQSRLINEQQPNQQKQQQILPINNQIVLISSQINIQPQQQLINQPTKISPKQEQNEPKHHLQTMNQSQIKPKQESEVLQQVQQVTYRAPPQNNLLERQQTRKHHNLNTSETGLNTTQNQDLNHQEEQMARQKNLLLQNIKKIKMKKFSGYDITIQPTKNESNSCSPCSPYSPTIQSPPSFPLQKSETVPLKMNATGNSKEIKSVAHRKQKSVTDFNLNLRNDYDCSENEEPQSFTNRKYTQENNYFPSRQSRASRHNAEMKIPFFTLEQKQNNEGQSVTNSVSKEESRKMNFSEFSRNSRENNTINLKISSININLHHPNYSGKIIKMHIDKNVYFTQTSKQLYFLTWKGKGYFFPNTSKNSILIIQLLEEIDGHQQSVAISKIHLLFLSTDQHGKILQFDDFIRNQRQEPVGRLILNYEIIEKRGKSLENRNKNKRQIQTLRLMDDSSSKNQKKKKRKLRVNKFSTEQSVVDDKKSILQMYKLPTNLAKHQSSLNSEILSHLSSRKKIQNSSSNKRKYTGGNILIPKASRFRQDQLIKGCEPGPGSYDMGSMFDRHATPL